MASCTCAFEAKLSDYMLEDTFCLYRGTENLHLAVLHPRNLAVYNVSGTSDNKKSFNEGVCMELMMPSFRSTRNIYIYAHYHDV